MEQTLHERIKELDAREADLETRDASVEADIELRLERLERRESALAELEKRLGQKEKEVAAYVGQVQEELERRESEWWQKQFGNQPQGENVSS